MPLLTEAPSLNLTQFLEIKLDAPSVLSATAPAGHRVPDSTRALLQLLELSATAANDLADGSPERSLDGVVSKSVLRCLLGALHHRDAGTVRHSRRVALLAVGLASHLGWEGRHLRILEVASLLHDIGKIGVPDNVLFKPGKLSSEELELMAMHYNVGIDVLQACRVDPQVLEIVDQSQRTYSRAGDSSRLLGRELHMGARILAVADAYESLYTEQVYRQAKSHGDIMSLLMNESNSQFDGNIVSALARWVQKDGLPLAAQAAGISESDRARNAPCPIDVGLASSICQIFSYLHNVESLYDGFHLIDANRRFMIWSRGAEILFGRSMKEMLG